MEQLIKKSRNVLFECLTIYLLGERFIKDKGRAQKTLLTDGRINESISSGYELEPLITMKIETHLKQM